MGATALWDPWDASPPTVEITGIKCASSDLLAKFKGRRKEVQGREWVKQTTHHFTAITQVTEVNLRLPVPPVKN